MFGSLAISLVVLLGQLFIFSSPIERFLMASIVVISKQRHIKTSIVSMVWQDGRHNSIS